MMQSLSKAACRGEPDDVDSRQSPCYCRAMENTRINSSDISVLRSLASRMAEEADSAENVERREAWFQHNALGHGRPLILAEISGVMDETVPDETLQCGNEWARGIERRLRAELYEHEVLKDDHVLEPWINVNWKVDATPFADSSEIVVHTRTLENGKQGAKNWEPIVRDIDRDFHKLRGRSFSVDRDSTLAEKERLEAAVGDILPVRIRGSFWWTFGMTAEVIDLIGLENLMLFMYDDPEGLRRIMRFMHDDHVAFAEWLEREGLLSLNNENDYIGSGSRGYTQELPKRGSEEEFFKANIDSAVKNTDTWILLESQETVGVGPDQFEEFIFPYQEDLAKRFGLVYYGCCEPLHSRFDIIKRLPNLRSVSVSPWANEEAMAEALDGRYVYSRKPNPSLISMDKFDEDVLRSDIRKTLELTRGSDVEIIMKDVHTLHGHPERLSRWVSIAREESERTAT